MARYVCKKEKAVTIKKANNYCLLNRCSELCVRRPIFKRGRLHYVIVQVISEWLMDSDFKCS